MRRLGFLHQVLDQLQHLRAVFAASASTYTEQQSQQGWSSHLVKLGLGVGLATGVFAANGISQCEQKASAGQTKVICCSWLERCTREQCTVAAFCNDCFGYQDKCHDMKLSLLTRSTVARMQQLGPNCIVLTFRVLYQVSVSREIAVLCCSWLEDY